MKQAQKGEHWDVATQEQGARQAGSRAHEQCDQEIGDEGIGKARAGALRMFGRKVFPVDETGNDAGVEWQVAIVVDRASPDRAIPLEHGMSAHTPQNHGEEEIKSDV